jgi:glycine dehydrogenase subunit 1
MAYIPHTEAERQEMLAAIGFESMEDMYSDLPEAVRFPDLALPDPASEMEVMEELQLLSQANLHVRQTSCFLGAGAYNHYVPSVVSQGTLQAIFEFQSLITFLTGMEVANASHYDGATSLAEAAILALNHHRGKRSKIVLSPGIHPQYREVVRTYLQGQQLEIVGDDSFSDDLSSHIDANTSMVAVQYPDFFGNIHDLEALGDSAREAGALLCVVANPIARSVFRSPLAALTSDSSQLSKSMFAISPAVWSQKRSTLAVNVDTCWLSPLVSSISAANGLHPTSAPTKV